MVNPKKFQTIVITKRNLRNNSESLSTTNITIKPKDSVERLGVTTDDKLTFEKYITKLCWLARCELNPIFELKKLLKFSSLKSFDRKSIQTSATVH